MAGFLPKFLVDRVYTTCKFENDTKYEVIFIDHVGSHTIEPGSFEPSWGVTKLFTVTLVIVFPDKSEARIDFPGTRYENRTHRMSFLFTDEIEKYEKEHGVADDAGGTEQEAIIGMDSLCGAWTFTHRYL